MDTVILPTAKDVRDLLSELMGRDATVNVADPFPLSGNASAMLGAYVDDRLTMTAVAVADFDLSAYAGAALGLVPKGGAEAAIEDGELPETLRDNTAEILNILASLFNVDGAPHQRLYSVHGPGGLPPADLLALAGRPGHRLDLAVTVAGYGAGRLSIVRA